MLNELTIKQAAEKLRKKEISSVELTKAVLEQIKNKDKNIHAYLTLTEEFALEQARELDKKRAYGEDLGILAGIPAAIKDNILVEGVKCTAASKILENYIAPYDATVVKELKKSGAVIVGKANMDEFAMGSSTENSAFGPTKNPHNLEYVPGGSSGGAAAAVAANECIYALGSDTGGSIRQPASFCGVVGLKPTYGRVSRYGLMAMASSLDQIGPLTKTVEDCLFVQAAIEGADKMDSTSLNPKFEILNSEQIQNSKFKVKDLRIGVPKEYFAKGIDIEVEESIKNAIKQFENLGAKIQEVSLPYTEYALACYYIIMPSEVSANLARYDGIKYGFSVGDVKGLLDVYLKSRQSGFGDEVRRRIMLGSYALSAGYYDAYYLNAQRVRTLVKEDFDRAFRQVDVLVTPTSPTPAFKLGEKIDDPLKMYLSDIYTVPINLAGIPALSMPCGKTSGLPIGLQIIGKHFDEKTIFNAAYAYEQSIMQ